MIKHNTPAVILLYLIFSIKPEIRAQFDGLRSFAWDTVLRVKLKESKVRTITETTTEYKEPYFTGKYFFDRDGRTIETW